MSEEQDPEVPAKESEEEKEQRIEHERQDLLARVGSSNLSTVRHRVAWLMNHFPRTRNSDITLQIKYWEAFDKGTFNGTYVPVDDLYKLTRLTSIARERAKIQNQYRLFLADQAIQERRGTLEESEREKAAETSDYPVYAVFLDESGKTSPHLIIGSLWFLSSGTETLDLYRNSTELREKRKFSGEFHFAHMKKDELDIYKELIDIFVTNGGTISFKWLSVPKHGIKNIQAALSDLYYLLLTKGIDHEDSTCRAPLPRILQVWKDSEEVGADKILMATLADKMKQAAVSVYGNKLVVETFVAMDSKSSVFLQVADIMASSMNRILCRAGEARNHKDELADYLVGRLGISVTPDLEIHVGDLAVHIKL
jgi:hypothetical protein